MKNTFAIIRNFLFGSFALLLISTSAFAAPLVRTAAGANTTDLSVAMAFFRKDLGGKINATGNSYTSGRREIDWEDYQQVIGYGSNYQFPYEYYNKIVPKGAIFNTAYKTLTQTMTMGVSKPHETQPGYVQFRRTNTIYPQAFRAFSGTKMFASLLNTRFEVSFCIPGTNIPATVSGFGAVFADVDDFAYMTFYDESGKIIAGESVPSLPNDGFSFVGVSFPDGTRIARVDIQLGTAHLDLTAGGNAPECQTPTCYRDYVAMDNVIYGEPRATEHHPSDFDGDGTSDLALFRPSNGTWYVLNSGTNTLTTTQFGVSGDVPVGGDFDGDSRNDLTIFRPSNGTWYILRGSTNQLQVTQFGANGDKPVAGDYDKDGITDIAVWRNNGYLILQSSNNQLKEAPVGLNGDIPIGSAVQ